MIRAVRERPRLTLASCTYRRLGAVGCRTGLACSGRGTHQAVYYRDSRGTEPVNEFIQALPPKRAAKIDDFIAEHLNGRPADAPPPGFPITSQIDGELRELRVRFANTRYRILYQRSANLVVLLHALEKDTGAVPRSDIELARQRMSDFKRRMNAPRRTSPRAAGTDAPPGSRPVAPTYQDG